MDTFNKIIGALFQNVINPLVTAISAFAFVWFLYGVFMFILARYNSDKDGIDKGKRHMIWGLVGLIIIFSASAIYKFITGFF